MIAPSEIRRALVHHVLRVELETTIDGNELAFVSPASGVCRDVPVDVRRQVESIYERQRWGSDKGVSPPKGSSPLVALTGFRSSKLLLRFT